MKQVDMETNALIELDKQCHEHLRESNRKKDTLLGFYLSATFILTGFFEKSFELTPMSVTLWTCYALLLTIGLVIGMVLTIYRGWHGCYVITSIVIQNLIKKSEQEVKFKFIKGIRFKFNSLISVELLMFFILSLFNAFNFYIMITIFSSIEIYAFFSKPFCWIIQITLLILFILEIFAHFTAMIFLDRFKNNGTLNEKYLWLLNGKIASDTKNT
jgi:hypothetical protein